MRPNWLVLFLVCAFSRVLSQPVTYRDDIAPILEKNCVECHREGGVGPFPLTTYVDVAKRSKFIGKVTESRYMPPFRADLNFQRYANERGLTQEEIALIKAWVEGGAPKGSGKGKEKKRPAHGDGKSSPASASRGEVLEFSMTRPYEVQGDGREDFRFFHIPTGLEEDVYVRAIEFRVGNRKVLHHSRLMTDTTGSMRAIDGLAEADPRVNAFRKTPLEEEFLYGWVPGNDLIEFPPGTAKRLRKGTDLLLNMHYAPTTLAETDRSGVRFYLTDAASVEREVKTLTLTENDITNQPFVLPAESRPTFFMSYGPTQRDMSLVSVMPHMHFLGKSFRAFAITADGDLVPFVKIDSWDYNWQMTYRFKGLLSLPKGSTIIAEATYDNTSGNPENPNQPAKQVGYGWNSTDEMMNLVLYYVDAQPGDR